MWTLEGLGALDAALVREQMKDANPRMRIQAIRASETLYKAGNRTFDADYHALAKDADTDVAIQALLTLGLFKAPDLGDVVKATQAASKARGVKEIGDFLLKPPAAVAGSATLTPEEMKVIEDGSGIYQSLCFSCHANDGRGTPLAGGAPGAMMAPPLAGSPRVNGHRDYVIKVLLKGMTGPLGEATASAADIMQPMGSNTDAWIASIASYVRSSFGNAGGMVTPADVGRVRAATASRKNPWTLKELQPTLPRRIEGQAAWKLTASHSAESAAVALTTRPWTTGAPQAPGMWFQVELAQPAMLTENRIRLTGPACRSRRRRRARRGCRRRRRGANSARIAVPAWLPRRGFAGRDEMGPACRGRQRQQRARRDHLRPGTRQVRPNHANRHRRERSELGDLQSPSLRGRTRQIAETRHFSPLLGSAAHRLSPRIPRSTGQVASYRNLLQLSKIRCLISGHAPGRRTSAAASEVACNQQREPGHGRVCLRGHRVAIVLTVPMFVARAVRRQAVLLAMGVIALSVTVATAPQRTVFRSTVDVIAVDVQVVDRDGNPDRADWPGGIRGLHQRSTAKSPVRPIPPACGRSRRAARCQPDR